MLNNLTSNTNTPKKTNEQKVDKCLLSLQDQINETNNRISDLQNEVVSECGRIDSIESDNIATRIVEAESTRTNSLQSDTGTIDDLKSTTINAEQIEVERSVKTRQITADAGFFDHLSVANDLYLNNVKACDTSTSRLKVSQSAEIKDLNVTTLATDNIQMSEDSIHIEKNGSSTDIDSNGITTPKIHSDEGFITDLETENIKSTTTNTTNLQATNGKIVSLETNALKAPFELNTDIQGSGKINIQPNIDLPSQWVSIRIPHEWLAKRWMFAGYWTDSTTTYNWAVSGFGSTETGVIAYNQTALETIRDFKFDKETGDLYIQVRAQDYIQYQIEYLKDVENDDIEPIDWAISREGIGTLYTPDHLRGYVFQSYNDDTVEFYFGGDVCLYSLKAEVQSFDWATYKNIGVVQCIRTPKEFDNGGNVVEWTSGTIGDYLTYREIDFGGNIGKITIPIWETPTIILSDECKEKLVKAEAFECWNGTYVKDGENTYPLTELGDNTTVHGLETVEDSLHVCANLCNQQFFSGEALDETELETVLDGGIAITCFVTKKPYYRLSVFPKSGAQTIGTLSCIVVDTEYNTTTPVGDFLCVDICCDDYPLYLCIQCGWLPNGDPDMRSSKATGIWENNGYTGFFTGGYFCANRRYWSDVSEVVECDGCITLCVKEDFTHCPGMGDQSKYKFWSCGSSGVRIQREQLLYGTVGCLTSYRKTTENNTPKLDEIAVYESTATLVDNKPVIYCEEQKSLLTTDCLNIECLDVESLNVAKNAVIGGDLYVKGVTYTTDEETVSTTDTNIILRQNNPASLANGELSGVVVNNYNGTGNVSLLGTDKDGTVRVGTSNTHSSTIEDICYKNGVWYNCDGCTVTVTGELVSWDAKEIVDEYTKYTNAVFVTFDTTNSVPLAARDEDKDMLDGSLTCWSECDWKIKTIGNPSKDEQVLESQYCNVTEVFSASGSSLVRCLQERGYVTFQDIVTDENPYGAYVVDTDNYRVDLDFRSSGSVCYDCATCLWSFDGLSWYKLSDETCSWYGPNSNIRVVVCDLNCCRWYYNWVDKKAGNYTFNTVAEYETFEASNNIPDGSVITILCENSRVYSEEV